MNENQNHIKSEVLELYKENRFLKLDAEAYRKSGSGVDKERLLLQLVLRIELHCAAPTPMVDTGVIMLIASNIDEEGKQWLPLFTDFDEVMLGNPTAYTVEVPMRHLVEDAFELGMYEGIIINPYSDNIRLGKRELDYVLDTILRIENGEEGGLLWKG